MTSSKPKDGIAPPEPLNRENSLVAVPLSAVPPGADPARRRRWFAVAFAVVAAAASVGAYFALNPGARPPVVSTEVLSPGTVERVLAVSGRTVAEHQSDISASVAGRVVAVRVNEGDRVAAGDRLIELDATRAQTTLRQAVAALDAAALSRQAAQDVASRAEALGDTVSAVALANARRALEAATLDVDRLTAALDRALADLDEMRLDAPIAGQVLTRAVEPGDWVDPSRVLLRLADTTQLAVEVQIDEALAAEIAPGQHADLQFVGRSEVLPGRVTLVAAEVDAETGSLRVRITPDASPVAQIGLTTVANILIDTTADALTVPRTALVAAGAGRGVLVFEDGRAVLRPVELVDWPADRVRVTAGLAPGDRVILAPEGISDGQAVTLAGTVGQGG